MSSTRNPWGQSKHDEANSEPEYLTYAQAATLLQLSERTLHSLVKSEGVPCVRLGKSVRFPRTRLQQWLDQRTVGGIRDEDARESE